MLDWSKIHYPHIFYNAQLESRQATHQDYYIPPSLASQCVVVTKTSFNETACHRLACFPFKQNLEPCTELDSVQWITMGNTFALACQPSCHTKDNQLDTEWRNGQCVQVNPYKKIVALFPERLFEIESKHSFHRGLDLIHGHLSINETYCKAYGLEMSRDECYSDLDQKIAEFFLGKTVYRAIKTANLKLPDMGPDPPIPGYFNYVRRVKRMVSLDIQDVPSSEIAQEVAIEIAADVGTDLALWIVEHILKKQAPKLLSQATTNIAIKSALTQAVLRSYTSSAVVMMQMAGKAIGKASSIFAVYSMISMVIDIVDPYNYEKVITAKMLDEIDYKLDLRYYGREEGFDRIVTPEFIWDHVWVFQDQSHRHEFMAEKIMEYLTALHTEPASELEPIPNQFCGKAQNNCGKRIGNCICKYLL
ncbi:baculo_p74_N domain-containing protein [Caerostris extrusa]|uniref:Baculo_p74_N domain-containing protein n=1 Tax=Caerostris extrusa TaxID=172846 RepID=A0AAV4X5C9_CAEEX|nr:baculo_p74_N domain-containing protein [Caerostris extrusa]